MNIRIATAPVSWGVLLKDTPNVPPWQQCVREIAAAGYTGMELGPYGYLPQDIPMLRDFLAELGLSIMGAFAIVNLIDPAARQEEYEETINTCRVIAALGSQWVVLSDSLFVAPIRHERHGRIRPEDGMDDRAWRAFTANAESFARRVLDEFGLRTAFHTHVGGWVETPAEVDRFLAETDPDLVHYCLDTAHTAYGGEDPVDALRRWGARVRYLHIKEFDDHVLQQVRANGWDYFRAVQEGVFPELGRGTVDFATLLELLEALDFDGWGTVEQDILPDSGAVPLASARRNLAHLRQLGYTD